MKSIVWSVVAFAAFVAVAADTQSEVATKKLTGAERRQASIAKAGGLLAVPNSQKGCIHIVNAQKEISEIEIQKVVPVLTKQDEFKVEVVSAEIKGCPVDYIKTVKDAGVVIVVISDDKSSSLLISPDEHWAIVNIKKLGEGLITADAKDKFYASRVRKQIIRAYVLACTGNGSQYVKNFFYVTNVSGLDLYNEFLPADSAEHCKTALAERGVTPVRRVVYRRACMEGWAPQPTNDVQKAIWDQLHEIPTEPMLIKPEKHSAK